MVDRLLAVTFLCLLLVFGGAFDSEAASRPNIVWIIPDDMSANFSCYGETAIQTPNVDRLAAEGVRFANAYVTAPVCSTCRSAFITGRYQTSIGAHHHRSGRGEKKIHLPAGMELVPQLFQEAGYYTTIGAWPIRPGKLGKTDYNFEWDTAIYDGPDWSGREPEQPFFAQIQTPGGKLRGENPKGWKRISAIAKQKLGASTPLDVVSLPPYYPRHPDIVRDWAAYLDTVRLTDLMVGEVIDRLEEEGVLDNTLVLFMTDHGISHARGKQFLYDEGLHVPLVIRGPGIEAGQTRTDLVEHIDIAALSLAAAGIALPEGMQARDILASDYTPRDAVFAARDRCDETVDHIRSVRTERYKYIRNYLPERPYLQPCAYKDAKAILIALRAWHQAGKLDDIQSLHLASSRPPEELYDVLADPHEVNNLAADPQHQVTLQAMRDHLAAWMIETDDQGRRPEPEAMFNSDMNVYLDVIRSRKGSESHLNTIEQNIALMRQWASEGK